MLAEQARRSVLQRFSLERMVDSFLALLSTVHARADLREHA